MKCPSCGEDTRVTNSRPASGTVRRRRQCSSCEKRFSSIELILTPELDKTQLALERHELVSKIDSLMRGKEVAIAR